MNIYGLAVLITFVLAALKVAGVLSIGWLAVFAPVGLAVVIGAALLVIAAVCLGIAALLERLGK